MKRVWRAIGMAFTLGTLAGSVSLWYWAMNVRTMDTFLGALALSIFALACVAYRVETSSWRA